MTPAFTGSTLLNVILCTPLLQLVAASLDAEQLYTFLMRDYNKLIRPVRTNDEALGVQLSLKFSQLIGVDEVNQVITTNVVVQQRWNDYKLQWNPAQFGGIEKLSIPCEAIWLPDVVLYNNAEGNYQITTMTKVMVRYDGSVIWNPPAIYKSYCLIDVTYFPYDKQSCTLRFGSWTYDALLVDLKPERGFVEDQKKIQIGMDLSEYKQSIEWDILEASAIRYKNVYSYGTYVDITFTLIIRRKTLFYTVNLIIPCVLISCLTVFVFYLPSDSGEKVTLCISILLSLTVFVLLLAEIIPPTSLTVPLMGRYLLFTLVMVTMSIAITIVVINVHFRNPSTHIMGPWVRKIFINFLPKLLLIERPGAVHREDEDTAENGEAIRESERSRVYAMPDTEGFSSPRHRNNILLNKDVQRAVHGINYIVEHVREANKIANTVKDWKYVAMVIDRLFLWIFAISCIVGTGKIILDAPPLYEMHEPIPKMCGLPINEEESWICFFKTDDD